MILALETSTFTTSVALGRGGRVLAARDARVSTHSETLLPLIDEMLRAAGLGPKDIEGVACGAGPGSFTGLRIGLATAKGLCYALDRALVTVSSLAALALEAPAEGELCLALLDARKGEVYAGLYRRDGATPQPVVEEAAMPPGKLAEWVAAAAGGTPVVVVGEGALAYPDAARACGRLATDLRATPSAASVLRLAEPVFAEGRPDRSRVATAVPHYIRPSEAEANLSKAPGPVAAKRVDPPRGHR